MSQNVTLLGPFRSIWVGVAGDDDPLIRVTTRRKKGGFLTHDIPEVSLPQYGNDRVPNGLCTLQVKLTFVIDSMIVQNIIYGRDVSNTDSTELPGANNFSLLLCHLDPDAPKSYWIPNLFHIKTRTDNREKLTQQETPVTLYWSDPNQYNLMYYEDTLAALITLMGDRSPF